MTLYNDLCDPFHYQAPRWAINMNQEYLGSHVRWQVFNTKSDIYPKIITFLCQWPNFRSIEQHSEHLVRIPVHSAFHPCSWHKVKQIVEYFWPWRILILGAFRNLFQILSKSAPDWFIDGDCHTLMIFSDLYFVCCVLECRGSVRFMNGLYTAVQPCTGM